MKREGQIYIWVGLVVLALMLLQYNPFSKHEKKLVSEVKQVSGFNRLLLDVNCNIFFVEGDDPGIVYEGSANMIKNLKIEVKQGCVTIRNKEKSLANTLTDWIMPDRARLLNIYVVVKDINNIEISDLMKNAGSANISRDRMKITINNNSEVSIGIRTCKQKV